MRLRIARHAQGWVIQKKIFMGWQIVQHGMYYPEFDPFNADEPVTFPTELEAFQYAYQTFRGMTNIQFEVGDGNRLHRL